MTERANVRFFGADVSQLNALARTFAEAEKIIKVEMQASGKRAAPHVTDEANRNLHNVSGLMAKSWRYKTQLVGDNFILSITNVAKSAAGFAYPAAVEFGRRAFHAIHAKALRWESGGQVFHAYSVAAAPAQNILSKASVAAQPAVEREFEVGRDRAAARIEALK